MIVFSFIWGIILVRGASYMAEFNNFVLRFGFGLMLISCSTLSEAENSIFLLLLIVHIKTSEWLFRALQALILTSRLNGNLSVCAHHECWPSCCLHICSLKTAHSCWSNEGFRQFPIWSCHSDTVLSLGLLYWHQNCKLMFCLHQAWICLFSLQHFKTKKEPVISRTKTSQPVRCLLSDHVSKSCSRKNTLFFEYIEATNNWSENERYDKQLLTIFKWKYYKSEISIMRHFLGRAFFVWMNANLFQRIGKISIRIGMYFGHIGFWCEQALSFVSPDCLLLNTRLVFFVICF